MLRQISWFSDEVVVNLGSSLLTTSPSIELLPSFIVEIIRVVMPEASAVVS